MLKKIAGITISIAAVIGGSLIIMGHLRSQEADFEASELGKLKRLSQSWEKRLLMVRTTFREQLWRHHTAPMLDHPEEWSPSRVTEKLSEVDRTWTRDHGVPHGYALLDGDGRVHTSLGDTTGLREALATFEQQGTADIIVGGAGSDQTGHVALIFAPPASRSAPAPGTLIALVESASVFLTQGEAPAAWTLLDGPKSTLYSSASAPMKSIQRSTWNLLISEGSGVINHPSGVPFGFCKMQIPGMSPLLLVSSIRPATASHGTASAMILIAGGTALLLLILWPSGPRSHLDAPDPGDAASRESVTFRQLFQSAQQPMCVVDSSGQLIRVNKAGRKLLRLQKGGKPDPELRVKSPDGEQTTAQFFESIVAGAGALQGPLQFTAGDSSVFCGTIDTTRLYADRSGKGPLLLEFHAHDPEDCDRVFDPDRAYHEEVDASADDYNPEPVILVGDDGIIKEYNEAAVEICPQLRETPLLADVLPGIERRELPGFFAAIEDDAFTSLLGSKSFRFRAVRSPAGILLYGYPLADTQELKIALDQAQENFNSLCSLTPAAVLVVDPWEHVILEANSHAGELLGMTDRELKGHSLDEFGSIPWESAEAIREFELEVPESEPSMCRFGHDLVKIEGEPALLAVLTPLPQPGADLARGLADEASAMAGAVRDAVTNPELPIGPGLLVVNNPSIREVARRMLDRAGVECEAFSSLDDATAWIFGHEVRPRILVVDLGDFDEVGEWISMVRDRCGEVPGLALTAGDDGELPEDGPNQYLEKPFELESLNRALAELSPEVDQVSTA